MSVYFFVEKTNTLKKKSQIFNKKLLPFSVKERVCGSFSFFFERNLHIGYVSPIGQVKLVGSPPFPVSTHPLFLFLSQVPVNRLCTHAHPITRHVHRAPP